jgi:hypothetical protein
VNDTWRPALAGRFFYRNSFPFTLILLAIKEPMAPQLLQSQEVSSMRKLSAFLAAGLLVLVIQADQVRASITAFSDEGLWPAGISRTVLADFEGFLGPVTNQYQGALFGGANGGHPFTVERFPYEGQNSMRTMPDTDGSGGFFIQLDPPVGAVSFRSFDVQFPGSIITIFGVDHSVLASYDMYESGGNHGHLSYGFNGFSSDFNSIATIQVTFPDNDAIWTDYVEIGFHDLTSVEPLLSRDVVFLRAVSPNPANGGVSVALEMPSPGHVKFQVFDLAGRFVATLLDENTAPGNRVLHWDARDESGRAVPSGTYFVRLEALGRVESKTVLIAK